MRRLAFRFRGGAEPTEDLLQVANLGLVHAIERFDPERGVPFVSFAAPTILGELRRHFRDRVWSVRLPRRMQERLGQVDAAVDRLAAELERSPTVREIASHLSIPDEEVLEALSADDARRTASFDQSGKAGEGGGTGLAESVGEEDGGFEQVEQRCLLASGLSKLDDRDLMALRLRFEEDLTQAEIARVIGCSQMQVSRILRSALDRIRAELEAA